MKTVLTTYVQFLHCHESNFLRKICNSIVRKTVWNNQYNNSCCLGWPSLLSKLLGHWLQGLWDFLCPNCLGCCFLSNNQWLSTVQKLVVESSYKNDAQRPVYSACRALGALVKAAGLVLRSLGEGRYKADKRTRSERSHGLVLKSKLRIYFKSECLACRHTSCCRLVP